MQWWRIIIDEAQSIRNEANDLAARVSLLHRVNSWVVTGTPIYSDINDLSGYFAFLDVDPFWDKDVFTFSVVDPYLDERNQKGVLRVHGLLPKIMRRYSKAHLAEEFRVPPMTEVELLVTLSEREAWHYGAARKLAGRSFDRFLKDIAMNRSRKLSQEQVRHLNNSIQDLRHRACVSVDVAGKPRIQELRVETDAVKQLPLNEIYQLAQAERYRAQSSRRHDAIRAASVYLAAASAHRKDGHNEMLDADFGENESEDAALLADAVDILLSALRDGNITCLSTDTPWDLIRSTIRGTLAGGALAESRTWTAELLKLDGLVAERGAKRSVRSIAFPHVRKAAKSFDKARKALTRAQERVNHVEHVIATNIEVPDTCQNCNEIMSGCVISLCCSLQPYACFACYQTWRAKQAKAQCLFCREPIRTDQLVIVRSESEAFHPDDLVQNLPEPEFAEEAPLVSRYGSKIAAVVDDLSRRFSADPASKAIIFSQFKDVLEETRDALAESEILAVEYTAGEKLRQALRSIREDPNVRVILMPLRGLNAAGLTLTCCDVVYLMEPTIVPGLEDQAVNRIHRMGQTRRTTFVRVIAKGTVDRGIVQIQKEKREHSANGGGSGNVREKRADFGLVEWTRLFKHEEVEAGPSGV